MSNRVISYDTDVNISASFTRTVDVTVFVSLKNGSNEVLSHCLYITIKRLNVSLTKTVK